MQEWLRTCAIGRDLRDGRRALGPRSPRLRTSTSAALGCRSTTRTAPNGLPGPELGDYTGIPVNDAARLRGDSYDADRISVVTEYQCRQHGGDYSMRGLATLRIGAQIEPATQRLLAFHTRIGFQSMERTIWLDGRAHPPPEAAHTWQGFLDRRVGGQHAHDHHDALEGELSTPQRLARDGEPHVHRALDEARRVPHGRHGDRRSGVVDRDARPQSELGSRSGPADGRNPMRVRHRDSRSGAAGAASPAGHESVAPRVRGTYGLPFEATRGGAETLYPEYRSKLGPPAKPPPAHCEIYCICSTLFDCQREPGTTLLGGRLPGVALGGPARAGASPPASAAPGPVPSSR